MHLGAVNIEHLVIFQGFMPQICSSLLGSPNYSPVTSHPSAETCLRATRERKLKPKGYVCAAFERN